MLSNLSNSNIQISYENEIIIEFLLYLYSDSINECTPAKIMKLLIMSIEYDVPRLTHICEKLIIPHIKERIQKFYDWAKAIGATQLENYIQKLMN